MLFLLQQSILSELTLTISNFLDCPAGYLGSGFCVPCADGSYAEVDDVVVVKIKTLVVFLVPLLHLAGRTFSY